MSQAETGEQWPCEAQEDEGQASMTGAAWGWGGHGMGSQRSGDQALWGLLDPSGQGCSVTGSLGLRDDQLVFSLGHAGHHVGKRQKAEAGGLL